MHEEDDWTQDIRINRSITRWLRIPDSSFYSYVTQKKTTTVLSFSFSFIIPKMIGEKIATTIFFCSFCILYASLLIEKCQSMKDQEDFSIGS